MNSIDFTEVFARYGFYDPDFIYYFNKQMQTQYSETLKDEIIVRFSSKPRIFAYDYKDCMKQLKEFSFACCNLYFMDNWIEVPFNYKKLVKLAKKTRPPPEIEKTYEQK